jgi:hypothetical protein
MNRKLFLSCFSSFGLSLLLWAGTAFGQSATVAPANSSPQYSVQGSLASAAPPPQGAAVSYASVTQLNDLLAQLEAASKATQDDLAKLRVEKWKTDGATKKRALADSDSIQHNLQKAMPEIIGKLRNAPEDMAATFRLYRNLDTLGYVLASVAESAGAFGSKDDYQALSNDVDGLDKNLKALAERLENLATSKEQEIVRLRADLKTAQAAIPAEPPKKIVVDDTQPQPAKKPVPKKKPVAKKPATTTTPATTPATPPAQPKPQ